MTPRHPSLLQSLKEVLINSSSRGAARRGDPEMYAESRHWVAALRSQRRTIRINQHLLKRLLAKKPRPLRYGIMAWLVVSGLFAAGACMAEPAELGRLFYSPAQRAQLETARTHNITQRASSSSRKHADSNSPPPPQRYDGVLIRSDGKTTRWIDGKPEVGPSSVPGLKPGQTRANGKVYEPYQILRPTLPRQNEPGIKESAP